MGRLLGAYGFGAVDPAVSSAGLGARWNEARTDQERVAAAVELAKRGDLSRRPECLAMLLRGVDDPGLAHDLAHLVLTTATADDAADPRLTAWAARLDGDLLFALAASGRFLLAPSALPLYLEIARTLLEHGIGAPNDWLDAATDSVAALAGVRVDLENLDDLDEFDPQTVLATLGGRAASIVGAVSAPYVHRGAPAHPWALLAEVDELAVSSRRSGRPFLGAAVLDLLSTWSGVMAPVVGHGPLEGAQVHAIRAWASVMDSLAWRPGVKYFYGHDVDGGPGLGGPASRHVD